MQQGKMGLSLLVVGCLLSSIQLALADCNPTQRIESNSAYTWGSVPTTYHAQYGYTPKLQLPFGSTRIVIYSPNPLSDHISVYSATDRYIATLLNHGYIELIYCSGKQKLHFTLPATNQTQQIQYQEKTLSLPPHITQFYALSIEKGELQLTLQRADDALLILTAYRRLRHTFERFAQGICQVNPMDSPLALSDEQLSLRSTDDKQKPVVAGEICKSVSASSKPVDLTVDVEFAFDQYSQSAISPLSQIRLARVMQLIKAGMQLQQVEIIGFADVGGPRSYNKILSLKRAQTVMNQLVRQGIDAKLIRVDGRGSMNHVSRRCHQQVLHQERVHCRVEDRRVEIRFIGKI